MSEYIEFSLLDEKGVERNVKMNKDDAEDVWILRERWGKYALKTPKFYKLIPHTENEHRRSRVGTRYYYLHRVFYYAHNPDWNINDRSRDNQIDHKDQNPFNNSISNLRVANHTMNQQNSSWAKGYCWSKQHNKWRATIYSDGKQKHLGLFGNEEDARNAYLEARTKYHTFAI